MPLSELGLWTSTLLVALIILSDLWAVMRVRKSRTSASNKAMWIIGIVAVPIIGVLAWIVAGPRHAPDTARY
ncbi:PLD nuclease N-terminal domain-containing protein [Pseudomonas sp. DTU_2021_1001937_2_SI_NGA_ILE_001]|uniref:PLD nuclease N-terminal domain-containing protein n=1 Tax=Pseudomonas sp. DTU_2021_1001937_2_SI_NGA_ILE_001 TaxID=3077589 RepID=UPI0025D34BB4|nr:PLD nuclease N-terminal domain-containing protein [Pseudomonas sp. DTU_2021_1001937_2_SI_NGA_ILE_001]WNW11908.1 PLD nuclease N-terminal domain-containing protein [Pseudomonas sp. DTU_2021_1001937_2_SI_NGA_ILE_001]